MRLSRPLVFVVFWLSGLAALLYQIVWQRALLTLFGSDMASVTVVVTAFMLGLGLGSLFGGALSRKPTRDVLAWFAAIELGIGAYGVASLSLFRAAAETGAGASVLGLAAVTFALVLFPTLLMGATLPLLVAHLVREDGDVGASVGWLYAVNTAGAACGAFAAAWFALRTFGLGGTVLAAAGLNGLVALTILGRCLWATQKAVA